MKYKMSLSKNGTFLEIRVLEAVTGNLEREFAERAIKDAKQKKMSNFLVDVRGIPNKASSVEQYFFGHKEVNQLGLDRGSRIAILANEDDKSHNFIETVFVNAGYRCRIFQDEDSAVKWLGE
jgi:hypothetical protein